MMDNQWQMELGDTVTFEAGEGLSGETFEVRPTDDGLEIRSTWGRLIIHPRVSNSVSIYSTRTKP